MAKREREKKKSCGIIIIDETWRFSFRNQTKGLRWPDVLRDHFLLFSTSFPDSERMRSSGNAM